MDFKSETSFKWLYSQEISKVKDLARIVQASHLWNENNKYKEMLISSSNEDSWNCNLRDTSRAASVLAITGIVYPEVEKWILSKQTDSSWNDDVYDSTYSLIALADMGCYNEKGCRWLVENYGKQWEHPGTTALIITALIKQDKLLKEGVFSDIIRDRARWIISQKEKNGAWKTLATSNLVIQSLILAELKDEIVEPLEWILSKINNNGSWGKEEGDINTTSLSLITIQEYKR
ncbi:hypothetical protein [Methanolobus sp.]|uniref:hypothetical protein n=1 Tax=Methanolobus sp. TaxID=1874737 RepID=UPI0025E29161|nr:hypothetical protein [Methanolobus sp.]